jgi:formyltetrahydrofolate deformylase
MSVRLVISCPDRPGVISAVSTFLAQAGANIVRSDQYSTDPAGGEFFLRMEFTGAAADIAERFGQDVGERFGMSWRFWDAARLKRVAILVSREDHCLQELLWRSRRGELEAELVLVASNHEDTRRDVEAFGLPFHHVPVTPDTKPAAEERLLELLAGRCDLVVLARYMQILSRAFLEAVGAPVINIHHSFLPAFAGAGPYRHARQRGVKLIGATAHYATEDLDEGPIIEQDITRVDHQLEPEQLVEAGRDVEAQVLARAVRWHAEHRVLMNGTRTVVFR